MPLRYYINIILVACIVLLTLLRKVFSKKPWSKIGFAILMFLILLPAVFFQINNYSKIPTANAAWFDAGWSARSLITIDHTKVGAGGVTNFPVLITESNMPASFWTGVKADGSDIRVTGSNGTTEINFELVSINTGTSKMELWFLAAALSDSAPDSTFYLYWGNAGASAKVASWGQGVWDSNYAGVYHFPNGSSLTTNDSTANSNNGSITGGVSAVAGLVGGGAHFDGSSGYVETGNLNNSYGSTTIEAWLYWEGGALDYQRALGDQGRITNFYRGGAFDYWTAFFSSPTHYYYMPHADSHFNPKYPNTCSCNLG